MQYKQRITLDNEPKNEGVEILPNDTSSKSGKEKKVRKKSVFRFYFLNIVLGIVILVMVGYIMSVSILITTQVNVTGSKLYDDEYIKEKVLKKGDLKKNSAYQVLMGLIAPTKDIPFIDKVSVGFETPSHLRITLKEKEMLGVIEADDGNYVYFDDDGIVKEISKRKLDSVIPVGGLKATKPVIGKSLSIDKEALKALLNTVKALRKYKISVDAVNFDGKSRISCVSGNVEVDFGSYDYLNEKIMRFDIILKKLDGKSGKLHLENWTPQTTDVVFQIKE